MIKINKYNGDISYTKGDTFRLPITPAFEGAFEGAQLRFVIALSETTEPTIDKLFDVNDDMRFTLTLSSAEISKLNIGDYLYKMTLIKNNTIVTEKSGNFEVKWGA